MTKTKEAKEPKTYNLKPKTMWEKGWEDGYMGRQEKEKNPKYADGYWVGVQQSMLDE
jgi:hypothetical protein